MIGIYPNATLTIDTISEDRAWARAIARGCLNGADRSPVTDLNGSSLSRLHGSNDHSGDKQSPRLRHDPINFDTIAHFGSAITPWEGKDRA